MENEEMKKMINSEAVLDFINITPEDTEEHKREVLMKLCNVMLSGVSAYRDLAKYDRYTVYKRVFAEYGKYGNVNEQRDEIYAKGKEAGKAWAFKVALLVLSIIVFVASVVGAFCDTYIVDFFHSTNSLLSWTAGLGFLSFLMVWASIQDLRKI